MSISISLHPNYWESDSTKANFWNRGANATLQIDWNKDEVTFFLGRLSTQDCELFLETLETAVEAVREWHESRLEAEDG